MKKVLLALATLAATFSLSAAPASAWAIYMGTTSYWNSNDAKVYCNVTVRTQSNGTKSCSGGSTAAFVQVKYPGQSSYCYRRNAYRIDRWSSGGFQFWWSGSLYYIC